MTIIPVKRKSKSGNVYYNLVDEKRVDGKVVQKYVGYLGKSLKSKNEIEPEEIVKYVSRLLDKGINQEEINDILKKIGIDYDAWPITKIVFENDLKLKKVFLKLK
jgi:ABC-type transport system involved in cytochrome c biogenesis ATPase subunit